MLIFLHHALALLAMPKTGSRALEFALKPRAEIVFARNRKHITAARYKRRVAPFLKSTFDVQPVSVAVMREPIEQIHSWYKFRSKSVLDGSEVSTKDLSFDQFVSEVVSDDPPPRAQIGRQFNFLTDRRGRIMVERLFSYAHQEDLLAFLSARLEHDVKLSLRNTSPPIDDSYLSTATLKRLREIRAKDFELYDQLMMAGGQKTYTAE
ncbi:MAG: hypothetical protein AAF755_05880 [Pseudomonadota bacterium]